MHDSLNLAPRREKKELSDKARESLIKAGRCSAIKAKERCSVRLLHVSNLKRILVLAHQRGLEKARSYVASHSDCHESFLIKTVKGKYGRVCLEDGLPSQEVTATVSPADSHPHASPSTSSS